MTAGDVGKRQDHKSLERGKVSDLGQALQMFV